MERTCWVAGAVRTLQNRVDLMEAKDSFKNVKDWVGEIDKHAVDGVNKLHVENKCDLASRKVVSTDVAEELANCPAPVVESVTPAPAVSYVSPAPVAEYLTPATVVCYAAPAHVLEFLENLTPAPAVFYAPAPVVECLTPAPAVFYAAPAPVVEYFTPAPAILHAARAPVEEHLAPAPVVSVVEAACTAEGHGREPSIIHEARGFDFDEAMHEHFQAEHVGGGAGAACVVKGVAETQVSPIPTGPEQVAR